jgi:hypothetical protein
MLMSIRVAGTYTVYVYILLVFDFVALVMMYCLVALLRVNCGRLR